jgi:hypothetical protein
MFGKKLKEELKENNAEACILVDKEISPELMSQINIAGGALKQCGHKKNTSGGSFYQDVKVMCHEK